MADDRKMTYRDMVERLIDNTGVFRNYMKRKKYSEAKKVYDDAVAVAEFLKLEEDDRKLLFGNRAYADKAEDVADGLFPEEMVDKCYLECAVKRNRGYENRKRRVYGEPQEYYQ